MRFDSYTLGPITLAIEAGFDGVEEQFLSLAGALSAMRLAYLHLVNHSSMGALAVPGRFIGHLRSAFKGTFIASGGLDRAKAEALLESGAADLVAFGRPVLANPEFLTRIKGDHALNAPDFSTFYTPGEVGYLDYPTLATVETSSVSRAGCCSGERRRS